MKLPFLFLFLFSACRVAAQAGSTVSYADVETYYAGINPVAPFTWLRTAFTSLYLPYAAGQEAGAALFIGKIWNRNYNVETRLSYGSPQPSYRMFQVHSGFNYCFNSRSPGWRPYAGLFVKLVKLDGMDSEVDKVNAIAYADAGNRFVFRPRRQHKSPRFFIDLRIQQQFAAVKWTNQPGTKAQGGFHSSIYKWSSPYIPYASINVGAFFR